MAVDQFQYVGFGGLVSRWLRSQVLVLLRFLVKFLYQCFYIENMLLVILIVDVKETTFGRVR